MKNKLNKFALLALSLSLVLTATACGSMTEKRVNGKDGVSAIASSNWTQVVSDDDLKNLYDTTDANVADVKLALANDNGKNGYLVVQTISPEEEVKNIKDYYSQYINKPDQLAAAVEDLKTIYLTEREIEQITPLIKGESLSEEQESYLNQELVLQGYLYNTENDTTSPSKLDKIFDSTINDQKVQIAEYTYDNSLGTKIRQYDAVLHAGAQYYYITLWDSDEDFAKNKETFEKVMQSIAVGEVSAESK